VQNYWPIIDSMNKGTFPKFADGGLVGGAVPSLAYPSLPSAQSLRPSGQVVHQHFTIDAKGSVLANDLYASLHDVATRSASAALAAAPAMSVQKMQKMQSNRLP
jgi:hypothetical protein